MEIWRWSNENESLYLEYRPLYIGTHISFSRTSPRNFPPRRFYAGNRSGDTEHLFARCGRNIYRVEFNLSRGTISGLTGTDIMSPSPVPTTNIVGNNLGPISVLQFGTVTTGAYGIVVRHNDQGAVVRYLLGGTRVVKDTTYAPIPVPSTMLLFGTGLAGLGLWRYRKSVRH